MINLYLHHINALTLNLTNLSSIPDKWAGYNGRKLISKQTLMKANNSGATTKR